MESEPLKFPSARLIESCTVAVTVELARTSTLHGLQSAFTASVCNLNPESRGEVHIRSADPAQAPLIASRLHSWARTVFPSTVSILGLSGVSPLSLATMSVISSKLESNMAEKPPRSVPR